MNRENEILGKKERKKRKKERKKERKTYFKNNKYF